MNRLINSGKRVDRVDRYSAASIRSTESTKVELIDRVDRFSVELSRFVRLDRFQGLPTTENLKIVNSESARADCAVN